MLIISSNCGRGAVGTPRQPVAAGRNTPEPTRSAPIPRGGCRSGAVAQPHGAEAEDDNAVVLALGTAEDTALSRLCAGEAISTALLYRDGDGLGKLSDHRAAGSPRNTRCGARRCLRGRMHFRRRGSYRLAPIGADPLPAAPRGR